MSERFDGHVPVTFHAPVPILRIFDVDKAKEFYLDYLDFRLDWEHRFDPDAPLYAQISSGDCVLHLSEHHGDGTPGTIVRIGTDGLDELHRRLAAKAYKYMRPGIEDGPGGREACVIDPFNNRLVFCER
ncbi:glyoxalase superfamily protein [Cohnella zeiphila]|uniref:glyoxalase superfamily protein n=1 Tax=Cohnella zeiphila TaxID=2761120 RepID=UPI003081022C